MAWSLQDAALEEYDETLQQCKTSLPQKLDVQFSKMRWLLQNFWLCTLSCCAVTAVEYAVSTLQTPIAAESVLVQITQQCSAQDCHGNERQCTP